MFYVWGKLCALCEQCNIPVDVNAVFVSDSLAYLPNIIRKGIYSDEGILFILRGAFGK
jgi:hypothetical protein